MLLSLIFSLCFSSTILDRLESPSVAGHRGGMQEASYNTLERFAGAIKEDVDILEMDLRATKDGVAIVFHDEDLDRKTTCKGLVAEQPWTFVKSCKIKGTNHLVPSFEEVAKLVKGQAIINAEFKTLSVIAPSIKIAQAYNMHSWVYFQANSELDKYQAARKLDATIPLLYKPRSEQELRWLEEINDPWIVVVQMDKDFVTKEHIQRVHSLGKLVSVNSWKWDVWEERFKSTCKKIYDLGIDIAVTNNTKDCVKVRNSRR